MIVVKALIKGTFAQLGNGCIVNKVVQCNYR